MSPDGRKQIDPVTGYETTGHEWNGIIELNTPFPRIVIAALLVTLVFSTIAWVFLPSWPTRDGYTPGLLHLTQQGLAAEGLRDLAKEQAPWRERLATKEFWLLKDDKALMAQMRPGAARLFGDNCAACHGLDGIGKQGFPSLAGKNWLWGGSPEAIAETISVGINSSDPDTRVSQMPAFGANGMLNRDEISMIANYVMSLSTGAPDLTGAGGQLFAANCSACHGERGRGGLGTGAPALTTQKRIYGETRAAIVQTIQFGRQGVMPAWRERLSESDIHMLALYVSDLGSRAIGPIQK